MVSATAATTSVAMATASIASLAMLTPFIFTPIESGIGGLTLGVVTYAKLQLTGRVLGISGAVRGIVHGDGGEAWRVAFVTGLLAGGLALRSLLPGAFEVLPASYTLTRAILAGLLVGLGTARGSGCTSGHGICGNARLSLRSFVATCTFMASGMLATRLAGTAAVFGLPQGIAPMAASGTLSQTAVAGSAILAAAAATWLLLSLAAKRLTAPSRTPSAAALQQELSEATALEKTALTDDSLPPASPDAQKLAALSTASDLFIGFLFALGLGISGMAKTSKVAGFLGVLSGTFDPSLMFVMGGALLVALPSFQLTLRRSDSRPLCSTKFELPSKTRIDANLVLGALTFGAGWGLGGICPGPGLVALATLQPKIFAFVAAMLVGMRLDKLADAVVSANLGKQAA